MIYIEETDGITSERFQALLEKLPPEKREEVNKLYFDKDKLPKVLAYNLLREALKFEYGLEEIPPFSYNKNGKPFFDSFPDIYFNLSHCDKAAVCVLDKIEVGVDVEDIAAFDFDLAQYVCNESELQEIIKSDNPDLAFTVLWTKKESYLKMRGRGLPEKNEIRSLLVGVASEIFSVYIKTEFVVTLCKFPCP